MDIRYQWIRNLVYPQKRYQDKHPGNCFMKIGGNWYMHPANDMDALALTEGVNFQELVGHSGPLVRCGKPDCKSILTFGGSFLGERAQNGLPIRAYQCTCCGAVQRYTTVSEEKIPLLCDETGRYLRIAA